MTYRTFVAFALSTLSFFATTQSAAADEPCGKFDFSDGVFDCKIEVEGGCTAQCTPLSFKAGCTGGCSGTATQDCTGSCGTACLAECNPELLDCFKGCHAECDAEVEALCKAEGGTVDCAEQAVAQCDMHCENSCEVPPSNCQDHCVSCCNGGCTTQVNFQCDFDCFAELKGGCDVQCSKPDGALFCNGQYVYASDITACITHLATQGINVDVSASATLECGADGCDLGADLSAGVCSTIPGRIPDAEILMTLMLAGLVMSVRRSAKASRNP
ncbi:MAG: hypothetical protein VB934_03445 [Polyangiaceae bacterium]